MSLRRLFSALLVLAAVASAGCVTRLGPGGAAPSILYTNVGYPNILNPNMSFRINFEREDIELIGPVEATATSKWYFFLVSRGDSGYGRLMAQAREQGADGVMNVTIDTEYNSYFLFYAVVTTRLNGIAYRYRR